MVEEKFAKILMSARRECVAVAPMDELSQQDLAFCYQVQKHLIALNNHAENRLSGWKVALSSQPALDRFSLQEPVYAPLFQANEIFGLVTRDQAIAPKIESEIMFVLGKDLSDSSNLTDEDILAAIESMAPAIEVADCRIQGWKFDISHFVADNAAAGFYQVGNLIPFEPMTLDKADFCCQLDTHDGIEVGQLNNVLGGPIGSLIRMVRGIVNVFGEVKAGQKLLSGSLTKPVDMVAGHTYRLRLLGQTLELQYK
ncbi:2-keto-4-pentenoate hydratase [Marinomonas piezotolerans]|uniref:2-keto-4-pentenoate hydratase n=1 Tax=Marinomonas piezotolerans TaxID=2213058 RepID=A0A370UCQ1_9GAMM|nr:2-keto-4-pentenoate hydratase [Marinomonas piezotolerans]RDL45564.1 2-keto-4-pentenoate hydratase [Marinomonas piezotolerans]